METYVTTMFHQYLVTGCYILQSLMMMVILVASFLSSLLSCGLTTRGTTQCPPFWTPSTTPFCVPTCLTQRETLPHMVCDHGWLGGGGGSEALPLWLVIKWSWVGGVGGGGATCQIQTETLPHMVSVYECVCVWGGGGLTTWEIQMRPFLWLVIMEGGGGG